MSPLPSVPPHTDSWEEAVTHGYYGARTDPLPDGVYSPEFGPDDIPASLTAVDPVEMDPAVEGGWQLQCTGVFPLVNEDQWSVVIVAGNGDEWPSMDLDPTALDTLTAFEFGGPNYPDAAGAGYVVLRYGTEEKSEHVPFTWNYSGPPSGEGGTE